MLDELDQREQLRPRRALRACFFDGAANSDLGAALVASVTGDGCLAQSQLRQADAFVMPLGQLERLVDLPLRRVEVPRCDECLGGIGQRFRSAGEHSQ